LYGDINGDAVVNAADNVKFKNALTTYNAAFDFNNDGTVNASDNVRFKADLVVNFSGFTPTV
jgi:Dockerin type I domain